MLIRWYCAAPLYKLLLHTNTEYQRGERREAQIGSWAPRGWIRSLKADIEGRGGGDTGNHVIYYSRL